MKFSQNTISFTDSPSKRQCLDDVNESAPLTKTEVKQRKVTSKEKDEPGEF